MDRTFHLLICLYMNLMLRLMYHLLVKQGTEGEIISDIASFQNRLSKYVDRFNLDDKISAPPREPCP